MTAIKNILKSRATRKAERRAGYKCAVRNDRYGWNCTCIHNCNH